MVGYPTAPLVGNLTTYLEIRQMVGNLTTYLEIQPNLLFGKTKTWGLCPRIP